MLVVGSFPARSIRHYIRDTGALFSYLLLGEGLGRALAVRVYMRGKMRFVGFRGNLWEKGGCYGAGDRQGKVASW